MSAPDPLDGLRERVEALLRAHVGVPVEDIAHAVLAVVRHVVDAPTAERDAALTRIAAAAQLHHRENREAWPGPERKYDICAHDREPMPCPTRRALGDVGEQEDPLTPEKLLRFTAAAERGLARDYTEADPAALGVTDDV